jgi:hypothetical protein
VGTLPLRGAVWGSDEFYIFSIFSTFWRSTFWSSTFKHSAKGPPCKRRSPVVEGRLAGQKLSAEEFQRFPGAVEPAGWHRARVGLWVVHGAPNTSFDGAFRLRSPTLASFQHWARIQKPVVTHYLVSSVWPDVLDCQTVQNIFIKLILYFNENVYDSIWCQMLHFHFI